MEGLMEWLGILSLIFLLAVWFYLSYRVAKWLLEPDSAYVAYEDNNGVTEIIYGEHYFGFGGQGDGYCYGHQTFDCVENLTEKDKEIISSAEGIN